MQGYGGSNFQLPVGGYLPSSQMTQKSLTSAGNAANQLWQVSQPGKKGKWSPLALQSQLPQYQQDVNQATQQIDAFAPNALAAAQNASNLGITNADMASGSVPGLYNLGGMMTGMAPGVFGQAQGVMNEQLGQMPGLDAYAQQALATGFDPQNALFNRTAQQMRDVLGASGEAAGVGGSPYGANLQSQGMENFLLDWQNQAAQRQAQGAQTAGSLYGTAAGLTAPGESLYNIGESLAQGGAGLDQTALGIGQGATQLASDAAQMPIKMAEDIATGKIGLQDALTQAKSNMYNQRTGGFNAQNQFLSTIDNFLKTAVGAESQNLGASQTGLNNMLGFASLPLQLMGK